MRKLSSGLGVSLFLCCFLALAQETPPVTPVPEAAAPAPPPTALELQQKAIEKQREAVRLQVGGASAGSHSFFTSGGMAIMPPVSTPGPAATTVASVDCEPLPDSQVEDLVKQSAQKHQVEAKLVRAVMRQESAFKPCAVSPKGAQGLMQLMPATAQQFGVADPFNPEQNVTAGVQLLRQLLDRYKGDIKLALSAYNAGTAAVDKINAIPDIPETQSYVRSIVSKIE